METQDSNGSPRDFIRDQIRQDVAAGRNEGRIHTRFPPEPNGYLHIGHAQAITLNFGIAGEFDGKVNLRFDDTNPEKEDVEYVDSIQDNIRWLGFSWDNLLYASDYFEQLYAWAQHLIREGLAYVDQLSPEQMREYRGTPTEPGRNSPWRDRPADESLDLLQRMRDGEFPDGAYVVRAKIDMAHANLNLRDPALYRIRRVAHHRTGDSWNIYPTYDFAHGQSDAIEGITHSICTLEFENHRPLYDWLIEHLPVPHRPRQIEFARLNLTHTVMSKRVLRRLVEDGHVDGWDDPRLPTISGLRRRGYTPQAIREFCLRVGVSKTNATTELALLEFSLREDLNERARRLMAVVDPVLVRVRNWPENTVDHFEADNHPSDRSRGTRRIAFSGSFYVEREDYMDDAPRKWFRMAPGKEVRLKYAYYVTVVDVLRDADGALREIIVEYDPESRGGDTPDGRKVKGTLHWVDAADAQAAEFRLYDTLFRDQVPDVANVELSELVNPNSMLQRNGFVEPAAVDVEPGESVQFLRSGYYCRDTASERLVFNRAVTLKDNWQRIVRNQRQNE